MANPAMNAEMQFQEQELDAMDRVINNENFKFLKIQEKLKNIIKIQNSLKSSQILAKKELHKACEKDLEEEGLVDERLKERRIHLREEKDQLHKAFIKHQSLSTSLQDAAFQTQVQDNFHKCLLENYNQKAEIPTTIQNCNDTLLKSSELARTFKRTEELDKEILLARLKYRGLLDSIDKKWNVLTNLGSRESRQQTYSLDDPELKLLQQKLTKREERLQLLTNLLQNCISASGEIWGANPRLLEIMLLCDGAFELVRRTEEITDGIANLNLQRKKTNKQQKYTGNLFSSTPK